MTVCTLHGVSVLAPCSRCVRRIAATPAPGRGAAPGSVRDAGCTWVCGIYIHVCVNLVPEHASCGTEVQAKLAVGSGFSDELAMACMRAEACSDVNRSDARLAEKVLLRIHSATSDGVASLTGEVQGWPPRMTGFILAGSRNSP